MASTFEERLIAASSREIFNAGKLLLKQGKLSGAFRGADGGIRAIFNDNKRYVRCMVRIGENFVSECDCEAENDSAVSLCPHAVAAILYNANFASGRPAETPDTSGAYAGMRRESLTELLKRAGTAPKAQVFLRAESEFPHVPSKWENSLLNVRLKSAQREYVGSINNLRQLYFDKALAITLKFDDFSLQDRQIIQFLAINAEAGDSHLMMNSEVTAEFFHCLGGFDRFTRNGRRLVIHDIPARAAILHVKNNKDDFYTPGLIYNRVPLPLSAAKVIVGRSGCWVGRDGEYFFVPASIEVNWLRNFFRLGEQRDGDQAMLSLLDGKQGTLPVIEIDSAELVKPPLQSVISGRRDENGALRICLQYFYDDVLLPADGGHIAVGGGKFFQRNEKCEFELENSLKMLKCECAGDEFVISDPEVQGMFLDEMLPDCVLSERRVMIADSILKLCGRSFGVAEVEFHVRFLTALADGFRLSCELAGGDGEKMALTATIRQLRRQRRYFINSAGRVVKVTAELAALLTALDTVASRIDEKNSTFDLPFHQVHFYRYLAEKLPFAVPPELCGSGTGVHALAAEPPGFKFEGTLRAYQSEGVEWMRSMAANNFNFILADEMGLGKTVQLLALIAGLRHRGDEPAMVICPASLVENWVRECNRFVPEFRTAGLAGGEREQVYENIAEYDFIAISYATARHDAERLRKLRFSFLALDEAQHIKNADTANFQSCKALTAVHRAVLTGTPLENSPEDLWSLFEFLHPGFLGSFNSFKARYANLHGDSARQKELAARVAPFIKRRLKNDVCRELPPKHEQLLMCEMGSAQRQLYDEVRELGRSQLKNLKPGEKRVPFEILTTLLRLRQICCHPPLVGAPQVESAKMELVRELILEHIDSGSRMLLFSQFTSLLSYIRAWLEEQSIKYEYLDGATRNRQQKVDDFNNSPDIPIFLLSLKAGGTGLNLTGADTVIIYDPWWNPAVEEQASDRTHRIGQTKPVSSLKLLVKDSIEERILAMKRQKQEIFDSVIENPELSTDKLSVKELAYLFG
ncbi:MAG: DEAD/DEAH box helicase [Victivallaceae bacterium]|nr:DEAD/DEAH box helicase [Victivallaceae bacterium]